MCNVRRLAVLVILTFGGLLLDVTEVNALTPFKAVAYDSADGRTPLANVTVTILNGNGVVIGTAMTMANGTTPNTATYDETKLAAGNAISVTFKRMNGLATTTINGLCGASPYPQGYMMCIPALVQP
jgi:hypothetical protein